MAQDTIDELEARIYDLRCEILMDKHVQFFRRYSELSVEEWFRQTRIVYSSRCIGDGDPITVKIKELFATEKLLTEIGYSTPD